MLELTKETKVSPPPGAFQNFLKDTGLSIVQYQYIRVILISIKEKILEKNGDKRFSWILELERTELFNFSKYSEQLP